MQNATFIIEGMHCGNCVGKVQMAFSQLPGVASAEVTLNPPVAHVQSEKILHLGDVNAALGTQGGYFVSREVDNQSPSVAAVPPSIYPLYLILGFIAGTVGLSGFAAGVATPAWYVNGFMAGFFLVFSFFKLLDLKGFASSYQMYDLIAQKVPAWASAYPFVELAFGVAFLVHFMATAVNIAEIVLMLVGAAGVFKALSDKRSIRCACLGSVLNLPMTTVSLVEDLGMAALGAVALALG